MFANVYTTTMCANDLASVNDNLTETDRAIERFKAKGGAIKKLALGEHTLDGFEAVDAEGFLYDEY